MALRDLRASFNEMVAKAPFGDMLTADVATYAQRFTDTVKSYFVSAQKQESSQQASYSLIPPLSKRLAYEAVLLALLTAACGGGGGGGTPPPPPVNRAPTISGVTVNPSSGVQPLNVQAAVGNISDDGLPTGSVVSCNYSWGDNSPIETATPCTTGTNRNHTYNGSGVIYTVSVTASDGQLTSASATASVSLNAAIPSLTLSGTIPDAENIGAGGTGCTGPFQGLAITLDHNSHTYNATTTTNCGYSFTVPGADRSGTNYVLHIPVNAVIHGRDHPITIPITNTTFTDNVESFQKYAESIVTCGVDAGQHLRILPFIRDVTGRDGSVIINGQPFTKLTRWQNNDIPVKNFTENPPNSPFDFSAITDTYIANANTTVPNAHVRVQADPQRGIRMIFGPNLVYRLVEEQFASDANGNPLNPLKYRMEVDTDLLSSILEVANAKEHEGWHSYFASDKHNRCPNSLMHGAPYGPVPASKNLLNQDKKALQIIRGISNGTDWAEFREQ